MKALERVLARIETWRAGAGETGAEDVARYALEPALRACGWDTGDPQTTGKVGRWGLALRSTPESPPMLIAHARTPGDLRAPAEDTGKAIEVQCDGHRWRIAQGPTRCVTLDARANGTGARRLAALIARSAAESGEAQRTLRTDALETALPGAWANLVRSATRQGPLGDDMREALAPLVTLLNAHIDPDTAPPPPATLMRIERHIVAHLRTEERPERTGARRSAQLEVSAPQGAALNPGEPGRGHVRRRFIETLGALERAHPGTLAALAHNHPTRYARDAEQLPKAIRAHAGEAEGWTIDCQVSAQSAARRLRNAFDAAGKPEHWSAKAISVEETEQAEDPEPAAHTGEEGDEGTDPDNGAGATTQAGVEDETNLGADTGDSAASGETT